MTEIDPKAKAGSVAGAAEGAPKNRAEATLRRMQQQLEAEEDAKVYQLALWPDDKRAMPTEFIACALFAGIQEKDAEYLNGIEIANANGFCIRFKGKRLTQVHADVWQGIMPLARSAHEGSRVRFRSRAFLRLIGRHTGKSQRAQLHGWITDLVATNVEVLDTAGKRLYFGSMLPEGARDDSSANDAAYVVEINRNLCKLFDTGFATVDWEQRRALRGKWLAQWLQHYFSRFKKPVSVAELHRLSGSRAQLKEFRRMLRRALADVAKSGGWCATLDRATDTVQPAPAEVVGRKPPSPSAAQGTLALPGVPAVTKRARERFAKLYPEHDGEQCLADFARWLADTNRTADKPDAAFLGFAKKWVARAG